MTNSADHTERETQSAYVGAGEPTVIAAQTRLEPSAHQQNSSGHNDIGTQPDDAGAAPAKVVTKPIGASPGPQTRADHSASENHQDVVGAGGGHASSETHSPAAAPTETITTIIELWRQRQAWHRAEKSLTLQCSAICRRWTEGARDDACKLLREIEQGVCKEEEPIIATMPLLTARDMINDQREALELQLCKMAADLPVAPWVENVRGFGMLSLAAIVGECGVVGDYKSVSAVWKRLGLAVINGQRQRRVTGDEALEHGYSPQRRSVAWTLGVALMRSQGANGHYRAFYDTEKQKHLDNGLSKGHAHNRAVRHMTKRLLRDLYGAWREAEGLPGRRHAMPSKKQASTRDRV